MTGTGLPVARGTSGSGLSLAAWAALLGPAAVLASTGSCAAVLAAAGLLGRGALVALAAGTLAGLLLCAGLVVAAAGVGAGLRTLRDDAVRRLHEPAGPVPGPSERPVVARASSELAELASVLDGLHQRVRVSDQVGLRHRRETQAVGAGVSELLSGLVAAEEGARGQLAAELHDTVAQSLMTARSMITSGPTSAAETARLRDFVEDAEEQLRAVMARTRPPALRDGDLASAVAGLQSDVLARYGMRVHVRWPDEPHPLPTSSAVIVYRFFQEALLNVVKHADVDDAWLALCVVGGEVRAQVRDEGPGFELSEVRSERGRHVGLGLLRERARLAGGAVEVDSRVGDGTTLRLRLPLPARTGAAADRAVRTG